ncbi:family C44 unassigned peptidase (C44 family) [Schistosoma mansoni]|uniref:family C44 unassigned peptidase (C44 family) n=1 Tax=Schistosoma mansoni TaxID=6183 RepID=UPI0001A63D28|nr:family C44 unassigned peptidase (C44 family) [Schistosoma mansoni]|eukprot:XP_018652568.1 family C44 unassigned peptidase (C44 family) [Schistosoma mansoni]
MCGIFAYLNYQVPVTRQVIINTLLNGLHRLEYRGYDSAGLAVDAVCPEQDDLSTNDGSHKTFIRVVRCKGKVASLGQAVKEFLTDHDFPNELITTHVGIAHTRWATHGEPNEVNAHPQRSGPDNGFVVVHNGIITNHIDLRALLSRRGYIFESETDTEVIPKFMQMIYDSHKENPITFLEVVELVAQQLEGSFALATKSCYYPGECVVARRGSPMLVGIKSPHELTMNHIPVFYKPNTSNTKYNVRPLSNDGHVELGDSSMEQVTHFLSGADGHREIEFFFASCASALIEHTDKVIFLEDDDVAAVRNGQLTIHRLSRSASATREVVTLQMELQQIMKGNYDYFMQKEIFEQPESVLNTMRGRIKFDMNTVKLGGLAEHLSAIRRCRRLIFIGCGTSYHSAVAGVIWLVQRDLLNRHLQIVLKGHLSQELEYYETEIGNQCFRISGDSPLSLSKCSHMATRIYSLCQESPTHCLLVAGVLFTKAYTSQLIALVMFALVLSEDRISLQPKRIAIIEALSKLSDQIRSILKLDSTLQELAKTIYMKKSILVMGRGYNYATCLEGALKLKELTYMHAEGIMSGELKHGPLAMIDSESTIIMIITRDRLFKKTLNALSEIRARKGHPIVICSEGDSQVMADASFAIQIPETVDCLQSVLAVIPLQLISFHIAVQRGLDVDCPRNLAKSVTVE